MWFMELTIQVNSPKCCLAHDSNLYTSQRKSWCYNLVEMIQFNRFVIYSDCVQLLSCAILDFCFINVILRRKQMLLPCKLLSSMKLYNIVDWGRPTRRSVFGLYCLNDKSSSYPVFVYHPTTKYMHMFISCVRKTQLKMLINTNLLFWFKCVGFLSEVLMTCNDFIFLWNSSEFSIIKSLTNNLSGHF